MTPSPRTAARALVLVPLAHFGAWVKCSSPISLCAALCHDDNLFTFTFKGGFDGIYTSALTSGREYWSVVHLQDHLIYFQSQINRMYDGVSLVLTRFPGRVWMASLTSPQQRSV